MNVNRGLKLALLGMVAYVFVGCSRDSGNTKEKEEAIQWLLKCPPVVNPSRWPPEAYTYHSAQEWGAAGRRIKGIEKILIGLLENNTSDRPRWIIVRALGWVGSQERIPALIKVLQDKEEPMTARIWAAVSLGKIRDKAAVAPLCEAVTEGGSEMLRWNAIYALKKIGDPSAKPTIERVLKDEKLTIKEEAELREVLRRLDGI